MGYLFFQVHKGLRMSELVASLLGLLTEGKYEESLLEAEKFLSRNPSKLDSAVCLFTIGSANHELGDEKSSLPFLLEALSTFPTTETLLIAHVQDELARVQFKLKNFNSALFFIEMAISNFELGGNAEMKTSCEALREEIHWQT
jgi:tetratricopeptide (TPR) repeat protein